MPNYSRISKGRATAMAATLLAMCALVVVAQSGRRARKSTAPVPVPTPEATPTPAPAQKSKPAFTFIVAIDRTGDFSRIPLNAFSGVLRNCADRLGDSPSVKVEVSTRDMSRSEAVRRAKEEKDAYIVLLQLHPNTFSGQTGIYDDPYDVFIQYSVFTPTTAKPATSGNVYPEAYRNKRVRLPTPSTNGDYYLNQAARGAAEKILGYFHKHLTNARP